MKKHGFYFGIVTPLLFMTLSGCLDFDRWDTRYKVSRDLSGQMSLQVTRIHSNEATPPAQKKEMQDLYQDFLGTMSGFKKDRVFDRIHATLSDKTFSQCSGSVQAHFKEFNAKTLNLVDEGFKVTRENGGLRFEIPKQTQNLGGSIRGSFTLVFEGVVVSHNAHRVDPDTGALIWDFPKIKDTGIVFTLKMS